MECLVEDTWLSYGQTNRTEMHLKDVKSFIRIYGNLNGLKKKQISIQTPSI